MNDKQLDQELLDKVNEFSKKFKGIKDVQEAFEKDKTMEKIGEIFFGDGFATIMSLLVGPDEMAVAAFCVGVMWQREIGDISLTDDQIGKLNDILKDVDLGKE